MFTNRVFSGGSADANLPGKNLTSVNQLIR
jgi:hypothetical protein